MPTPSAENIQLLSIFAIAFTVPTFSKVLVLIYGTILAPGRRTVTSALRAMGLADDKGYGKYHRVLNRDRWSPWVVSKILLGLLIRVFVPEGGMLLLRSMSIWNDVGGRRSSTRGCFGIRSVQPSSG